MKNSAILLFILIYSLTAFGQKSKPVQKSTQPAKTVKKAAAAKPSPTPLNAGNEKEEFEKAVAIADNTERIAALQKFLKDFSQSAEKTRALELIVSARAAIADEKLRLNEIESGVEMFKLAVKDAPATFSDKFFSEVMLQIPSNVFWRGQREAALEIAQTIEAKSGDNPKQLIGLAGFYLGTENASEARRLANKALGIEPNLPNAHQILGLAYRMNFQPEESAAAYAKALELDPGSIVSKRSLAEMKRASGTPEEAIILYREILATSPDDRIAQTGLALALFDSGKKTEAEAEMNKAFDTNPNNLLLLVGAAYWYAANSDGSKAVELAQKAVAIEPRYTWAHIALARGFLLQKQPLEAEKTLLIARQYGNFPTLDYEIAAAKMQAGFFREAAEELSKNFRVEGENVRTLLGGRVAKSSKSFIELLSQERRASIFQPLAADDLESSNKLRALLEFNQKLNSPKIDEAELAESAENFVKGDDKMKLHRQLFAADQLLRKKAALAKVYELAQAAIGNTDSALEVANASAAVLADELYESRALSISRNQFVIVPTIPRQTLSAVLRGRIEEIAGWTLYQQNKPAEASVRLKRAVSVLPDKSAWWRSSMWRLGAALEADGKEKEALDSYIRSYPKDAPEGSKYIVIESLYKKLNGNTEGLEARIGEKPVSIFTTGTESVAQNAEKSSELPTSTPEITTEPTPSPSPEKSPAVVEDAAVPSVPMPEATPVPAPEVKPESSPSPLPLIESTPKTEPSPTETKIPEAETKPTPIAESAPEATPEPQPNLQTSEPSSKAAASLQPTSEAVSPSLTETSSLPKSEIIVKTETDLPKIEAGGAASIPSENNETPAKAAPVSKPLFEPVIITIPKLETIKTPQAEPKETAKIEPDLRPANEPVEEKAAETVAENQDTKPGEKISAENLNSGANRLRVIVEDKLAPKAIQPCPIIVSQENISLLNGGGSIGILVGFEKDGKLSDIEASSSSPNDIDVSFEPEIGAQSGRAFFVVKSISVKTGEFKIFFETPCGKKEVNVRVR